MTTNGTDEGAETGNTDGEPEEEAADETAGGEVIQDGGSAAAAEVPDFEPTTSTGLDENVLGALAYFFGVISGVLVFVLESDNEFARFHGAQSAVLSVGVIATYMGLTMVSFVFTLLDIPILSFLIGIGIWLVIMAFGFASFLVWLYMMYAAFQGKRTKIPVVGNLVEKNLV